MICDTDVAIRGHARAQVLIFGDLSSKVVRGWLLAPALLFHHTTMWASPPGKRNA